MLPGFHEVIAKTCRFIGWVIIGAMTLWIATTNVQPNVVIDRIIMGFVMVLLSYVIEIRNALLDR